MSPDFACLVQEALNCAETMCLSDFVIELVKALGQAGFTHSMSSRKKVQRSDLTLKTLAVSTPPQHDDCDASFCKVARVRPHNARNNRGLPEFTRSDIVILRLSGERQGIPHLAFQDSPLACVRPCLLPAIGIRGSVIRRAAR